MFQSIRNFWKLPVLDKQLLAEAILFLFLAKLLLLLFPFKTSLKFIHPKQCSTNTPENRVLNQIKIALLRSDKFSFWENKCIVLCFAGKWMLNRRKIKSLMTIGVLTDENGKLNPHAWLKVKEFEIIEKGGTYLELYRL